MLANEDTTVYRTEALLGLVHLKPFIKTRGVSADEVKALYRSLNKTTNKLMGDVEARNF